MTGVLDSGLRRNDGGGGIRRYPCAAPPALTVIPAKAGIHTPAYRGNPHPFILRPSQDERMLPAILLYTAAPANLSQTAIPASIPVIPA